MEWRSRGESIRLNTEKGLSKMIYGDRIDAYRCEHCKKIIISYE
ncbi:PF20097 family protein [Blautia sp. NSJ-166]